MKPKKLVLEFHVDGKRVKVSARIRLGRAVAIPLGIDQDGEGVADETQTPRRLPNTTPTRKR